MENKKRIQTHSPRGYLKVYFCQRPMAPWSPWADRIETLHLIHVKFAFSLFDEMKQKIPILLWLLSISFSTLITLHCNPNSSIIRWYWFVFALNENLNDYNSGIELYPSEFLISISITITAHQLSNTIFFALPNTTTNRREYCDCNLGRHTTLDFYYYYLFFFFIITMGSFR